MKVVLALQWLASPFDTQLWYEKCKDDWKHELNKISKGKSKMKYLLSIHPPRLWTPQWTFRYSSLLAKLSGRSPSTLWGGRKQTILKNAHIHELNLLDRNVAFKYPYFPLLIWYIGRTFLWMYTISSILCVSQGLIK